MKRPLFVIGISYFFATWIAFIWGGRLSLKLALVAVLLGIFCRLMGNKACAAHIFSVVFLTGATAFAGFWIYHTEQIKPMLALSGKNAVVEGLITDVTSSSVSTTYTMRATFVAHPGIKNSTPFIIQNIGEQEFSAGDTVRCKVSLISAPDTLWYKSRGIFLIGRNPRDIEHIPADGYRPSRAIMRLGDMLSHNLFMRLKDDNAGIVSSMVLGQKNDVRPEIYEAVNRAGTMHLLSVSGLHLSILSAFLLTLFKVFRLPRRLGAILAIAVCFLFSVLAGLGAPVLRSFVMTAIMLSGRAISRRSDSRTSLGFALLFCSIKWPYWALNWGLWLSAGSTLGIIMFGSKISDALYERFKPHNLRFSGIVKAISYGFGISFSAYVFTAPLIFLMSGWLSLVSPLTNVMVSPFVPIVILFGLACAIMPDIPFITDAVILITDFCTEMVVGISRVLSRVSFAVIALDEFYLLIFIMLVFAVVILLIACRANSGMIRYAAVLLVLSFSLGNLSFSMARRGELELVTLAPRNAALLIRGDEAVILGTPDAYEISNLLKYLNYRGIKKISAVIATDSGDRAGSGLLRLVDGYETGLVLSPNDAYIEETLRQALPGAAVLSCGYAEVTALGKAIITTDLQTGGICVQAGKNEIVKIRGKYDIINKTASRLPLSRNSREWPIISREHDIIRPESGGIHIYDEGVMLLPGGASPAFEPLGAYLFGESRILLD